MVFLEPVSGLSRFSDAPAMEEIVEYRKDLVAIGKPGASTSALPSARKCS